MKTAQAYYLLSFILFGIKVHSQTIEFSTLDPNYNSFYSETQNNLWISSKEGWTSYDGVNSKLYRLEGAQGLKGSVVQSPLYKYSGGLLWTTTYEYLCSFDTGIDSFQCEQLVINDTLIKSGYRIVGQNESTSELVVKAGSKMLTYDTNSRKVISVSPFETIANTFTSSTYTGKTEIYGALWINGPGYEKWTYSEKGKWTKEYNDLKEINAPIVTKAIKHNGELFILSDKGLIVKNNEETKFLLKGAAFSYGIIWKDQLILSSAGKGLWVYDLISKKVILKAQKGSKLLDLLSDTPQELFLDSEDNLWLSHRGLGIQKINLNRFIHGIKLPFDHTPPFKSGSSDTISFHVSTNEGLYIKQLSKARYLPLDSPYLPINIITDTEILDTSTIIVSDLRTIYSCGLTGPCKKLYYNKSSQITDLAVEEGHISFIDQFVWKKLDTSLSKVIEEVEIVDARKISVTEKESYAIVGSSKLVWANGKKKIDVKSYINDVINCNEEVYISTDQGLYQLLNNKLKQIVREDHILHKAAISNLTKYDDDLYFLANKSIYKYDTDKKALTNLLLIQFDLSGTTSFFIQNDTAWVGNNVLVPISLSLLSTVPKVELDLSFEGEGYHQKEIQSLGIQASQNKFSLFGKVRFPNYNDHQKYKLRYKLIRDQIKWQDYNTQSGIDLSFLPAGVYDIKIQAQDYSGNIVGKTQFNLCINPPWYKSIWFFFLIGISLIGLISWYYRQKIKSIEKSKLLSQEIAQLEKSALQAQMNPHFIFNCLNSIQAFIMDNEKDQAMDYLGQFAQLIRSNLNASIEPVISLSEEIRILENYLSLEQLRLGHKFEYDISVAEDMAIHKIQIPPMLIQPFVENAVIHGMKNIQENGLIKINFSKDENELSVSITDNGTKGSTLSAAGHKSVGIDITKKRLAHINKSASESLDVDIKHTNSGTIILLKIKTSPSS